MSQCITASHRERQQRMSSLAPMGSLNLAELSVTNLIALLECDSLKDHLPSFAFSFQTLSQGSFTRWIHEMDPKDLENVTFHLARQVTFLPLVIELLSNYLRSNLLHTFLKKKLKKKLGRKILVQWQSLDKITPPSSS